MDRFTTQLNIINTTGVNNVAVGRGALMKNTIATVNTAVGNYALFNTTTGGSNSAFGNGALYKNITSTGNTAMGKDALYSNTASNNDSEGLPLVLSQIDLGCKLYFVNISEGTRNLLFLNPNGTLLKYSHIPIALPSNPITCYIC